MDEERENEGLTGPVGAEETPRVSGIEKAGGDAAGESREGGPEPGGEEERSVLEEMDRLRGEMDHLKELYLRKLAEFDNFRKRVDRERIQMQKTAAADLVRELVPVLDNFERALQHADDSGFSSFREGVELIARQLWEVLARQGLEVIDPEGEKFDPVYHEAVQRVENAESEPGHVVSVLAKGYTFGGQLVRPAMVSVAVRPEKDERPAGAARPAAGEGEDPA